MKKLLVSACLLGIRCRYDGKSCPVDAASGLNERFTLIPVCPEVLGGLDTPRTPAERTGESVVTRDGRDVTEAYRLGAEMTLSIARQAGCSGALMKERSPSCGKGKIYDGTFSGTLRSGDGICAELLKNEGIRIYGESEIEELLFQNNESASRR